MAVINAKNRSARVSAILQPEFNNTPGTPPGPQKVPGAPEAPQPHPIVGRAPPAMGVNLRTLLEEMVSLGASDLHIVAGECPKLRIDGEMTSARTGGVLGPKDTLQLAYSVLT